MNVGVNAVIDKSRGAVLGVIAAPDHVHHVTERRFADFAPVPVSIDFQDFLDRAQFLTAQNFPKVVLCKRNALAQDFPGLFLEFRSHGFEQLLAKRGAASTTGGSARAFFELG